MFSVGERRDREGDTPRKIRKKIRVGEKTTCKWQQFSAVPPAAPGYLKLSVLAEQEKVGRKLRENSYLSFQEKASRSSYLTFFLKNIAMKSDQKPPNRRKSVMCYVSSPRPWSSEMVVAPKTAQQRYGPEDNRPSVKTLKNDIFSVFLPTN